ncbi:hypothetical protein DSM101010T_27650 [Desulfovibrio subterraneus]|uniref:Uncharacterized protein n=1 Tax=Desulfovibrio subterraneus TaxID=2718620 RepID=A0A7J0BL61_9BACT|nr:hypothetical protein DSM101010T_27650 [Desulfovibrio subterraneus]
MVRPELLFFACRVQALRATTHIFFLQKMLRCAGHSAIMYRLAYWIEIWQRLQVRGKADDAPSAVRKCRMHAVPHAAAEYIASRKGESNYSQNVLQAISPAGFAD